MILELGVTNITNLNTFVNYEYISVKEAKKN